VYVLTYRVSDNAGNAATPVTRTITVTDQGAPVTLSGSSAITVAAVFTLMLEQQLQTILMATSQHVFQ
jgi:hypothetical protein